ncbi:Guanylate cyclase [Seminavis robusta]|uniref:Guanylate cyclase n=1 Tax=Seminavis robusta TaxID=568900 RepID=A0A9N8EPM9_9STRA|nr:Guanylate cyclase [Seminavis robusta]|eukprot:Sro1501_g277920.1 Guanylate cyclase (624) ;mRNA; r:16101-18584
MEETKELMTAVPMEDRSVWRPKHVQRQRSMILPFQRLVLALLSILAASANLAVVSGLEEGEKETNTETSDGLPVQECGVWLAPSSIPGAGLGMFAGKDFRKGQELQPTGDIVIPIVDITYHQYALGSRYFLLFDDYIWNAHFQHMDHLGYIHVMVFSPGIGSAPNAFADIVNVNELHPRNSDPHGLHRSKDPGAGAFSTYHDRRFLACEDIQKGEELFMHYGETIGDLRKADKVFERFFEIQKKHRKIPGEILGELWVSFVERNEFNESTTFAAFQKTDEEWYMLHQQMTLKEIRIKESMRTDEWFHQFGTCADNLMEGESTIRQAGRGAFATRHLAKDSVVAPLPLVHVEDSHMFDMLEFEDIFTLQTANVKYGEQLLLNYCFGHGRSSLLLCPYGPQTSLINHNQTRANVKLRWADPAKGNHKPELLEMPIEHFARKKKTSLALELVALRDIQPGEEVFLDYGDEWESAWQEHVKTWEAYPQAKDYVSAHQLDSSPDRLLTEFEQMENPYPWNVNLLCNIKFYKMIDFSLFHQTGKVEVTDHHTAEWFTCEIMRFRLINGQMRYTAVAKINDNKSEKLTDAPREAFKFVDLAYSSDMFLPNAFRHALMIPDDIFPEAWKNL